MARLKLTQPGFEKFTGLMCGLDFVDGVTVESQPAPNYENAIRALMKVETVEEPAPEEEDKREQK